MARVGVEWINTFPGPCTQNQLSYCDDTSVGFLNGMTSRGHAAAFNWGEGNAWETDFRDTSLGGDDASWVDNVEFAHFSSHGGAGSNNVFTGCFGTKHNECTWSSNRARFGDRALNWLLLDACQSLDLGRNIIQMWHSTFQGLHAVFGFTRNVSDSWWTAGRGYNFGRRAGNGDRLGGAWLDESYSWWVDDNPVVMAAGRSPADANFRRDFETVFSNLGDIPNNQISWYSWKWRD